MVACHVSSTGDLNHNPGMCPDWELNQCPFGSQAGTQFTEPHSPGLERFFYILLSYNWLSLNFQLCSFPSPWLCIKTISVDLQLWPLLLLGKMSNQMCCMEFCSLRGFPCTTPFFRITHKLAYDDAAGHFWVMSGCHADHL